METFGKILAHSISQTGICIANLSPAIYHYIIDGNYVQAIDHLQIEDMSSIPMAKYYVEEVRLKKIIKTNRKTTAYNIKFK